MDRRRTKRNGGRRARIDVGPGALAAVAAAWLAGCSAGQLEESDLDAAANEVGELEAAIIAPPCLSPPIDPGFSRPGRACGGTRDAKCPRGFVCRSNPRDDCDPTVVGSDCTGTCFPVTCRPPPSPIRCGGPFDIACPGALTCVDNPLDDCFPERGDSACSGVCQLSVRDCDPTLPCLQVITCVDGDLYPTRCGPATCDRPVGECGDR